MPLFPAWARKEPAKSEWPHCMSTSAFIAEGQMASTGLPEDDRALKSLLTARTNLYPPSASTDSSHPPPDFLPSGGRLYAAFSPPTAAKVRNLSTEASLCSPSVCHVGNHLFLAPPTLRSELLGAD